MYIQVYSTVTLYNLYNIYIYMCVCMYYYWYTMHVYVCQSVESLSMTPLQEGLFRKITHHPNPYASTIWTHLDKSVLSSTPNRSQRSQWQHYTRKRLATMQLVHQTTRFARKR